MADGILRHRPGRIRERGHQTLGSMPVATDRGNAGRAGQVISAIVPKIGSSNAGGRGTA
jgi:hypothetical protein